MDKLRYQLRNQILRNNAMQARIIEMEAELKKHTKRRKHTPNFSKNIENLAPSMQAVLNYMYDSAGAEFLPEDIASCTKWPVSTVERCLRYIRQYKICGVETENAKHDNRVYWKYVT